MERMAMEETMEHEESRGWEYGFLAASVVGAAGPLYHFAEFVREHGLDVGAFVEGLWVTAPSRMFTVDLVISGCVVFAMVAVATKRGVRGSWLAAAATILVGVSFGLPLLLYLERRHARRSG